MNTNEQLVVLHDFMIPGASHIEFQVKSLDAVLHSTWLVQEFTGGMLVLILSSASQNAIIFIYIYIFVYNDDKHLQFQRFFEQEKRLGFIWTLANVVNGAGYADQGLLNQIETLRFTILDSTLLLFVWCRYWHWWMFQPPKATFSFPLGDDDVHLHWCYAPP